MSQARISVASLNRIRIQWQIDEQAVDIEISVSEARQLAAALDRCATRTDEMLLTNLLALNHERRAT